MDDETFDAAFQDAINMNEIREIVRLEKLAAEALKREREAAKEEEQLA